MATNKESADWGGVDQGGRQSPGKFRQIIIPGSRGDIPNTRCVYEHLVLILHPNRLMWMLRVNRSLINYYQVNPLTMSHFCEGSLTLLTTHTSAGMQWRRFTRSEDLQR
jgi:hypothetical protein